MDAAPPPGQAPLCSPHGIPFNLSLPRALARQHMEWDLHLGFIGLEREVRLSVPPRGGANVLLLHTLLEVLRNLE